MVTSLALSGNVGWRQDRQTFDALTVQARPQKNLLVNYSYITKRNCIFSNHADLDSKDHLLNVSYDSSLGKLVGYAYRLEVDRAGQNSLHTYGVRLTGSTTVEELKWLYHGEVATQRSDTGSGDYSANYWLLEGGIALNYVTARLGYEVLGSDNSAYGFATPLATLHKFNGWADQFIGTPSQGLVDTYLSFSGGFAGGNWLIALHDFDTDEGTPLVENLGREIDFQYTRKFFENYTLGIKYASYSNGDAASGKVDTDKLWVWLSAAF